MRFILDSEHSVLNIGCYTFCLYTGSGYIYLNILPQYFANRQLNLLQWYPNCFDILNVVEEGRNFR